MKKVEAKKIIDSYRPHAGFFDLSEKPKHLSDTEYAKILETQLFLVEQNEQREYVKKHLPVQWEKLKEVSAALQQIIFQHWGDKIFDC